MSFELSIWLGILFCISQSAIFSGLNLAFFSVSRLRLEVETAAGNRNAQRVFELRKDSNFLLTTILWGNVGINVLLTLLSDSVMAGAVAFLFSTVVITFLGEIIPQAYFSRHALRMASMLAPVMRMYQLILFPVAKPVAVLLDRMLGTEGIQYFREKNLREVIKKHIESSESDVDQLEGTGALNFLAIDDLMISQEGETVDPRSIITLPFIDRRPVVPKIERSPTDPFLHKVQASGKKWVILTDTTGQPWLVLDADRFLRSMLLETDTFDFMVFCHRPIVISDLSKPLGAVLSQLKVHAETPEDDVIDNDIILVWAKEKRVITGADILGRLLRGIVKREPAPSRRQ